MSKTVDERVVEMRFDNKQFEANVATSMSTLDKLKKSLDLNGAAKGFDELGNAAKKCDMSTIGRSVETVQAKFSALQVVAMTALANITNSAMNAGKQLLSSLTIEPISTGFSEYELKMGSIQTIMASTGESLDRVNQKLDELNKYSDRTIYSFSDMTSNIGKFTNAGVKLDDAVSAIQGVSNVAAVSGANANEASRAMYNFAQALSAGYVKLIDWKSIENANMATVEFKTQLLESAVAAGTLTKTTDGMYKTIAKGTVIDATHMFNDSLQEQWMTTEVLTNTLKDYADETTEIGKKAFAAAQDVKTWSQLLDTLKEGAQSGWAETWQLVAGDYEEAKATLRTFSEFFSGIIDGSSEARNSLLQGALMSSWGQLKDRVNETGNSVDTFREVLRETAEKSVDGLDKMIEEAGSFDATLSQGWLTTDILADTLDNMVSKTVGAKVSISELSDEQLKNAGYTQDQIDALRALSDEARSSSGNIAELVSTMGRQSGRELLFDSLLNAAKAVQSIFQALKGAWQEVFPPATSDQLYNLIDALHSASERLRDFFALSEDGKPLNETFANIQSTFKGVFAVLDIVGQAFSGLIRAIAPAGSAVGGLLSGIFGLTGGFGEWLSSLDEIIKKNDIFYKGFKTIVDFIKGAITTVENFGAALAEKLHLPSLDKVKESIKSFLSILNEKVGAPGLESIHGLFERICARAAQVRDAIIRMKDGIVESFAKVDTAVSENKFVQVLEGIWTVAKKVASTIGDLLGKAFDGVINALSNANFNGILDFLNALAAGGLIAAFKKFLDPINEMKDTFGGFIDWVKGIGSGVTKILDSVRGCLEAYQTKLKSDAIGKIAAAIAVLAASLLVMSLIDSSKLARSVGAMTAMFAELVGALAILDKMDVDAKGANKSASAMIKMGAALLILSLAMKNIAQLSPEQLAEGLIGIGVLLAEIDVFLNTAKFDKNASKTAKGMILFAAAIKILASAVTDLSELSWENMAKGLIGVGVLLAEVDVFLNTTKFSGKSVLTATGIVLLASAITILASACKTFGEMSWESIAKGLGSIGILLGEITLFTKLTGDAKHVIATGLALIEIGAAMKIFASAMKSFGSMNWSEIAKGLVAMGGALAEVTIAMNLMPKNMVGLGLGLIAVAAALKIIADVLGQMGGMSWEEIAKGLVALGGALAELSIALNLMNGTLGGSAALLVAAGALAVLTPVLVILGNMSWESIAKGLITLAGAFTVIGVAGAVLGPLVPSILGLSAALALIGVGAVAIGAGLVLIGAGLTSVSVGLTSLAAALASSVTIIVAGLSAIILGIAGLIPAIAEKIGEAIVAFCGVITNGAPAIGEAIKAVVLTLVDVLVQCVPAIADGALQLVVGVLEALVSYTPQIIDSVMQFLIGVLEGIARNIPQLIQAAMDVVGAFFEGVLSALSNIDADSLIKGIAAIGLLTALVAALGVVAALIPAALVGVAGMGVVVTELAVVLAAIGALAQIPGLEWLISEGGQLLETIGAAIGGFVGGIVGGFMSGVSSSFPQIGADLSAFMTNVQPFIDGAQSIGPGLLEGITNLTGAILLITAADLLEGLTSWLSGGSSLADYGNELVPFGEAMVKFSDTISGLDADLVGKAATAGKTLAEMAATLPDSGGVFGFFAGENDMGEFGDQLVIFGEGIMKFAETVNGLDADTVQNAATAGKAMAEMAATLPNTGGAVAFFTGDNDMSTFGDQLVPFGKAIKAYANEVSGLDVDAVTNSAIAGQALVELAQTVPNTGGAVAFFTGDNDLATFGTQLVIFGKAMKDYSLAVTGLDTEAVTNSAIAGAALVELANTIPNTGGLISFFAGDNDLETFGNQLAPFGAGMKAYSDSLVGFDAEAVSASASAGQALSELAKTIPNTGGLISFFTGDKNLETFAEGLIPFGDAMKKYGESVSGLDQHAEAIEASVVAGNALFELSKTLPSSAGAVDFFTGQSDMSAFGAGIVPFGTAMRNYGDAVAGLETHTAAIEASVIAGNSLSELAKTLPRSGGAVAFFAGGNDLGSFATGIVPFGKAMRDYGNAVTGLEAHSGAIEASAIAGKSLVELANTLPKCGGLSQVFSGSNSLASFGNELVQFGKDLSAYSVAIKDVKPEIVTASANAAQALSSLATDLPSASLFDQWFGGNNTLEAFGKQIKAFGDDMGYYYSKIGNLDSGKLSSVVKQVWSLVDVAKGVQGLDTSGMSGFGKALKAMADSGITEFTNAFSNSKSKVTTAVKSMLDGVSSSISGNKSLVSKGMQDVMTTLAAVVTQKATEINASVTKMMTGVSNSIRDNTSSAKSAMQAVMAGALNVIKGYSNQFYTAGANVGQGFVNGINSKLSSSTAAGRSLGLAALNAAKKALDSHSPSREFIYLGENMGEGLAIGAKNSIVPASQATSKMINEVLKVSKKGIDAFQKWAEEKKYYGELSLKDELAGYENLQRKYKAGSEARIKIDREVYRIQNELVASTYQASLDWIEQEKFYNRLSTQEELEAYERMQKRYLEGSEERMEIDKKVFTLRNQLVEESYQYSMNWIEQEKYYNRLSLEEELAAYERVQKRYAQGTEEYEKMEREKFRVRNEIEKASYDYSMSWIEEEKYYNRMSLADELAAYKRVQSRYAKGTEERKKMDREVYRVETEIYEAQKQYIADVQSVQEEANQKRLELEEEYAEKVKSINEKLQSDIESAWESYQNSVESRTNSLYNSYGLFDEVKEKEEVSGETLLKNLQDQVQEFGDWQDTLDSLSAKGLSSEMVEELQQMGPSSIAQIKALNNMSSSELEKYVSLWSIKHAQARSQAVSELEGLRIETQNTIAKLRADADSELTEYKATWQTKMEQINTDTNAQLEKLRQDFGEKVGLIKKNTEEEMQEMADTAKAILTEAGWDEAGQQIPVGMAEGVEENKSVFLDALTQMALEGVEAVKSTLDINSPSRVFQELGNFTGLGFVKGLEDYADQSYDAGSFMAESAVDGFSTAIQTVADIADGDMEFQPTIRPVLDLSDVANGADAVNGLFNNQRLLALAGQTSYSFSANAGNNDMTITVDNDGVVRAITSLRGDISDLGEAVRKMQIVLDTGVLAGAMAEPIDSALGQRVIYRGRGI